MGKLIMSENVKQIESDSTKALWYVAHTYSGYENKVKENIEAAVIRRNMSDIIEEVVVPMHKVEETKNGERKILEKKIFPGYVLVKMYMTDDAWYVVRNTRGVTGFVGPASKPVPLTEEELKNLGIKEKETVVIDLNEGDEIEVLDGPFKSYAGVIEEVNYDKRTLKVNISMFGRETPVELDFEQVQKN